MMNTSYEKYQVHLLENESRNCAVLDTACTSTVYGQKWLHCFLGTLIDMGDLLCNAHRVRRFSNLE